MSRRLDHQALAPDGMRALGAVHGYIAETGLPPMLIDLVYLRVSQINGCAYCISLHTRDLLKAGVPYGKLSMLVAWREAGALFDEDERAALAWAETVTRVAETGVPDEAFAAASVRFEPKKLVDLTLAIGMINSFNRMAISFRAVPLSIPAR
ncbi:MAG: carboxymuconolactone decarboxylase family protein [Caldimonas sp.]